MKKDISIKMEIKERRRIEMRSIDLEEMALLLHYELVSRYKVYDEIKEKHNEAYADNWLKAHKDHEFVSKIGFKPVTARWKKKLKKEGKLPTTGFDHRNTVDYFSKAALELMELYGVEHKIGDKTAYAYEHMIPKAKYIMNPLKEKAKQGILELEDVRALLDKYYYVACITKEEDGKLNRNSMPEDWDGECIEARYKAKDIELVANKLFEV
ncbi:hypothetical protein [Enterococcus larvae]|uniref:hypothetical protein n=1 Tax=Enterococcus larvae TaxID=2794352 RepID=UPI003F3856E0